MRAKVQDDFMAMGIALKNLGNSFQDPLTPVSQLIFVSPHAQCQSPCAGCNFAAKIMNVVRACVVDSDDGADHAVSEIGFR